MKWIVFAVVGIFASQVYADECATVEKIAGHVMKARQDGEQMEVMMKAARMQQGSYSTLVEQIVIDAYMRDVHSDKRLSEKEIVEFANRNYRLCKSL